MKLFFERKKFLLKQNQIFSFSLIHTLALPIALCFSRSLCRCRKLRRSQTLPSTSSSSIWHSQTKNYVHSARQLSNNNNTHTAHKIKKIKQIILYIYYNFSWHSTRNGLKAFVLFFLHIISFSLNIFDVRRVRRSFSSSLTLSGSRSASIVPFSWQYSKQTINLYDTNLCLVCVMCLYVLIW